MTKKSKNKRKEMNKMNILEALELMKQGKKIRQKNWKKGDCMTFNGEKLVLMSKKNSLWYDVVISLSDAYKDEWEELKKPILDEAEKRYLSAVIRPFRENVQSIKKGEVTRLQCICIELKNEIFDLPFFAKDTMYKGMKVGKRYTLKELGL